MPDVNLTGLVTGLLLVIFGPITVKILERLMGNAPTWVWRVLAFLCIAAGWTIVMLNDPIKGQVKRHPKAFVFLTALVLLVAALLVRTRLFDAVHSADVAQRDHIVARLRDFIREANEPDAFFSGRKAGLRGIREKVEEFLSLYSTGWIQRVNEKGLPALDEISAELLSGAPVPPLLGPSSGQAQTRFSIEVKRAIVSPLISPEDHIVVGSKLFFYLQIVRTGTSSFIRTFGVDITTEDTKYTVEQPERGKLYYPLGFGGDGQEIENLRESHWGPFQHGQGQEGYLVFHLKDMPGPGELSKTTPKYLNGALAEIWIVDWSGRKDHSKGVEIKTFEHE